MTYRPTPDEEFSPRKGPAHGAPHRRRTTLRTLLLGLAALFVAVYAVDAMLGGIAPEPSGAAWSAASETRPAASAWRDATPQEAQDIMRQRRGDEAFMIIDLRTPQEFAEGHLADARNIDFRGADFRDRLRSLNRNRTYLVYCRSGNRSGMSRSTFAELGFTSVLHLSGGTLAWEAANLPLER